MQLGDDRQPVSSLASARRLQALAAEALEASTGGARLVRAAAQQLRAGVLDDLRGVEQLLARLDRARAGDQS